MKSCLFIPFATLENYNTGANISTKEKASEIYLKNLCVAAISAKVNGANVVVVGGGNSLSDSDIVVVVNFNIPPIYKSVLDKYDIKIVYCPFDAFNFGAKYTWSLAFYKLCALKYMVENHLYDNYAFIDADVYVQDSIENIWKECIYGRILLLDINHGLQVSLYQNFLKDVSRFGVYEKITHYGGEFFAASKENSHIFVEKCADIYNKMINSEFITAMGDEFITSIAANEFKPLVKNAGAYIFRFETGCFYLVSTRYEFNPLTILHVPAEKLDGMIRVFDKYVSKGKIPSRKKVWSMLHLSRPSIKTRLSIIRNRILNK